MFQLQVALSAAGVLHNTHHVHQCPGWIKVFFPSEASNLSLKALLFHSEIPQSEIKIAEDAPAASSGWVYAVECVAENDGAASWLADAINVEASHSDHSQTILDHLWLRPPQGILVFHMIYIYSNDINIL